MGFVITKYEHDEDVTFDVSKTVMDKVIYVGNSSARININSTC